MSEELHDHADDVAGREVAAQHKVAGAGRVRPSRARDWSRGRWAKYQNLPLVDLVLGFYRRDRDSAGSVVGSAIAIRLFLFLVPLLLFVVGVAGFISGFVQSQDVNTTAGVTGNLALHISAAFHEPGSTRWVATLLGLFGMVTAGRSLSKVLVSASSVAWRLSTIGRVSFRAVGAIAGLVVGMGLVSVLVNRLREGLGYGVATLSFVPVFVVYTVAWLGVSMLLPSATDDPGAVLPGSVFVALTLTGMHAFSELYLPGRLTETNRVYGALSTTIVTLGWLLILGRATAVAMELNAFIYERFGSISRFVFSLPAIRVLARRSVRIRNFFDLDTGALEEPG